MGRLREFCAEVEGGAVEGVEEFRATPIALTYGLFARH